MLRRSGLGAPAAAFLLVLSAAAIGFPLYGVVWAALSGQGLADADAWSVDVPRLARSLLTAALIAALATACGWPAAWASRALPARWFAVLLVPMLLPSYLAFIGWSQLRAPGRWLGDWLMQGPSGGPNWWPVAAAQVCAIGGLVLWSWPLAALIVAAQLRRLDPDVFDALRLEPGPAWRRSATALNLCRGGLAAGAAAVFLVMLGSAVPLHVAQLDTYAIELWRRLVETPEGEHWKIWTASWPLLLVAALGAVWLGNRLRHAPERGAGEPRRGRSRVRLSRAAMAAAAVLWSMSVVVPGALMALDIRHADFVSEFWRTHGGSVAVTGGIAAVTGLAGLLIGAAVWMGLSGWRDTAGAGLTRAAVMVMIGAGLVPGVLVGAGTAAAWNQLGWGSAAAGVASVVFAHMARLGFVGALAGWWASRTDPAEERALRAIDGAETPRGWLRAVWPSQAGLILAAAGAVGLLSLHEIEAAVMVQPPGLDSFPRQMLQLLHYNRMEDLAAAVVVVLGCGLLASGAIVGFASLRRRPGADGMHV